MTPTTTLRCARCLLSALVLGAGGLAHADTTGERDRSPRAERSTERGEGAANVRRDTVEQQREARQDRRDDARETRSAVRQDNRDARRDTVEQQRETRQDRRDDARDTRSAVRQDNRDERRDTVQLRRDDRRDDRRVAHAERRHYPSRGAVVQVLPPAHRVVAHRGGRYMFASGVWYRPSGSRFVVVAPPLGIVVPVLPLGYLTLHIGPSRYYYLNDVYYVREPRGYVVVERPVGAPESIEDDVPEAGLQQFIYPRHGQSEAQQAEDRYECHRWAREQTGFDPTRPMGDGSSAQVEAVRSDYYRAMGACLDGRGYTVR